MGLIPNQTLAIATSRTSDHIRRWRLVGASLLPAMAMFVFYPLQSRFAKEEGKRFPYRIRLSSNDEGIRFWEPGRGLKIYGTKQIEEEDMKDLKGVDDVDMNLSNMNYPIKVEPDREFQRPSPKDRFCICQNRNDTYQYIACIRGEKCVVNGWVHSECIGITGDAVKRLRKLWVCPVCVREELS